MTWCNVHRSCTWRHSLVLSFLAILSLLITVVHQPSDVLTPKMQISNAASKAISIGHSETPKTKLRAQLDLATQSDGNYKSKAEIKKQSGVALKVSNQTALLTPEVLSRKKGAQTDMELEAGNVEALESGDGRVTDKQWQELLPYLTPPRRSFSRGGFQNEEQRNQTYNLTHIMAERRRHLHKACKTMPLLDTFFYRRKRLSAATVWLNKKDKHIFCPQGKVSSTNWRALFWLFSGLIDQSTFESVKNPEYFWDTHYGPVMQKIKALGQNTTFLESKADIKDDHWGVWLNSSRKWLVVRHPFERLASAYRNKVVEINYVRSHVLAERPKNQTGLPEVPTFSEFVDFLIKHYIMDDPMGHDFHWDTTWSRCAPCDMDYEFVIHYEHLDQEANYVLEQIGGRVKQFPSMGKYYSKIKNSTSSAQLVDKYFKTLSYNQIQKLISVFEKDFRLFQYV